MAHGTWHMAHGTWHMAHGTWHMAHGTWHIIYHISYIISRIIAKCAVEGITINLQGITSCINLQDNNNNNHKMTPHGNLFVDIVFMV